MSAEPDSARARYGWESDFPTFSEAEPRVVRISLQDFLEDAGDSQIRAWDDSIPKIQVEVGEVVEIDELAQQYTAILEYELPLESRRPDVVLLVNGAVVVLELKGKAEPEQADLDQAAAYARDLRCYHKYCADREVHAVLVPTRAHGYAGVRDGVHIAGPDSLHGLIQKLQRPWEQGPITADEFLAKDAYCPLPSLVQAARELFLDGKIRPIHRALAETQPAIDAVSDIAHEAARTRTRHLVLVAGVPGSGKTLVGLSAVHNPSLDDLRVERAGGKPPAPAIFLSGNGPLVEVLQYELRSAGGGGKTFVRGVKDYMKQYLGDRGAIPPQHVIVYDEAQRAWDLEQVIKKHPGIREHKSEPEAFVEFGERIPEWCVLVGLIGSGQEINVGEEAGLGQWLEALQRAGSAEQWTVHAPQRVLDEFFADPSLAAGRAASETLDLTVELRFHFAADLDEWVDGLLTDGDEAYGRELAERLEAAGYHLRMTRDLETAKSYFHKRYEEAPAARYGLVASSRDKILAEWGIPNDYQSTKVMRLGPWYGDGDDSHRSCRHLRECVTEFGAQGLELDGVLLAWGTDLMWTGDAWSNARAKNHARGTHVRDPFQLRVNAYRVLLTRGRDGAVIFVPPLAELDATAARLQGHGVKMLWPRPRRSPQPPCRLAIVTLCAARGPAYDGRMKILFLDESGDHSLSVIDPQYPVFVLGGVVVDAGYAAGEMDAAVRDFKCGLFGRDDVTLHTADIVRQQGDFAMLVDPGRRRVFRDGLNALMGRLDYTVIACAIRKDAHLAAYGPAALDPYTLSLNVLVERFCFALADANETQPGAIVAERRDQALDSALLASWQHLRERGTAYLRPGAIRDRIAHLRLEPKRAGIAGLELADLVVSPIGRFVAGKQPREDWAIVESKLRRRKGDYLGAGLVILPKE